MNNCEVRCIKSNCSFTGESYFSKSLCRKAADGLDTVYSFTEINSVEAEMCVLTAVTSVKTC